MPKTILNGKVYGTDDYADLTNKPQIAGNTLSGNVSLATLGAIPASEKGANNGVATLDGSGKVPSTQLPAYVDDVVEYANLAAFPATGVASILYLALDTNALYRWSGSTYVSVTSGSGALALGETASTAYRGDRGKTAYDHSQLVTGNPHGTVGGDISLTLTDAAASTTLPVTTASNVGTLIQSIRNNLKALLGYFTSGVLKVANGGTGVSTVGGTGTQAKVLASPKSGAAAAPTWTTLDKTDVGLANVDNTSDANKPVSTAVSTALAGKQASLNRTVIGDDNGTATVTDTGGNLSIAMPVTTVAPSASTTQTTAGTRSIRAQIKILVDNIAALFGYFTSGKLKIANGGTGVATVAGQSATQRKVFASPVSTTAGAPSFVALSPADIGLTATATELNYVDGVTSAIQTQLDSKASTASLGSLATKSTIVNADVDSGAAIEGWKINGNVFYGESTSGSADNPKIVTLSPAYANTNFGVADLVGSILAVKFTVFNQYPALSLQIGKDTSGVSVAAPSATRTWQNAWAANDVLLFYVKSATQIVYIPSENFDDILGDLAYKDTAPSSSITFTTAEANALSSGVTSTIVGKAIQNDGAASKVVTIAVVASLPSTPATDTLYLVG